MKPYFWSGVGMICAGKAQQWLGYAVSSRKQQLLGFDREIRGKARIALGDADRLIGAYRPSVSSRTHPE
jgi:hypothetical protein